MQPARRDWPPLLSRLLVILAGLLVVLAAFAVLYVVFSVLHRFSQVILLFILGAILAYLLAPLTRAAMAVVRARWAAVLIVYLLLIAAFVGLGALLFTPFVQQSQSLVQNLRKPSQGSLQALSAIQTNTNHIKTELVSQQILLAGKTQVLPADVQRTQADILNLQRDIAGLSNTTVTSSAIKGAPIRIPPSYAKPITVPAGRLGLDYAAATKTRTVDLSLLTKATADAGQVSGAVGQTRQAVSSTPILVLSLQGWLDDHHIKVNLQQNFGKAIQQLNNQAASLLNSAVGILLSVGNLMLNTILVLIISIYFLSDGARLIRSAVNRLPRSQHNEGWFFVQSLDRVMGSYIRGQIVLAAVAGLLGGLGAWVLGVPYAVLIGITTFVLQLVPVIGPVVLIVPPAVIGFIFTPLPTPIILLVYFLVMEQVVTNIIGPRVMSTAVGIHPLEAMAAALIGFPLAGFLGSFFAVPLVGFIHILGREAVRYYRDGQPHPEAVGPNGEVPGAAPPPPSKTPI